MKIRLSRIFPALLLLFMAGCQNLDDIYTQLADHENRLDKLEALTSDANKQIMALQALIDAQSNTVSIVSYEALADGSGYVLKMSDGKTITLTNGEDGQAPVVAVKTDTDGKMYWTLDGEFMLDADGNKIPAAGEDGADAVAPKLRVNAEGFWEVSTDGGKRWELILDAENNPVKAVGSGAAVDLTITEDGDNIVINYNGTEFIVPKASAGGTDTPIVEGEAFEVTFGALTVVDEMTKTLSVTVTPKDPAMTYVLDAMETSVFPAYTVATQKAFIDFWNSTPTFATVSGNQTKDINITAGFDMSTYEMAFLPYYVFVYGVAEDKTALTDLYLYEYDTAAGTYKKVDLPKE